MLPGRPSIASEAIRAGRPAISSSFRFRRPRGPLCGRGYCSQCEIVTGDGRALACLTPAGARIARRRARSRALGRLAERYTPWFYERRFLRPRRLRRAALHLLRFLPAAAPLGTTAPRVRVRTYETVDAGVVHVGAGVPPAGAFVVDPAAGDVVLGVYPGRRLGLLRGSRMLEVSFERLVLATGSYERLPPVPGNDLAGVVGIAAAEAYAAAGALRPGLRVAAWAAPDQRGRVEALAADGRLSLVWMDAVAPRRIEGRRRVRALRTDRRIACDLFVVAVHQPAIDLALQAGATATLTSGELPVLALSETPDWLEVVGDAARTTSGVPDVEPKADAIVCACEDVRVSDLKASVAQGFGQPELVKRRTGAMTGPCQGKLCSASVLAVLRDAGVEATPTRARPLDRPVTLAELAADA